MKNLNTLIVIAASLLFVNCSSDDDSSAVTNPHAEFAGEYNLTFVGAPQPVDYNQDGTPSDNLMEESVCYADSQIVLNADHTYTMTNSYVFFISETGCKEDETFGTWDIEGETLILTDITLELPANIEYSIVDNTLQKTYTAALYPSRDDAGEPMYLEGDVHYIFTKSN